MTVINRALDKAYKRRAQSQPAPEPTQSSSATSAEPAKDVASDTVSGWASKLRDPIRPLNRPVVAIESALTISEPAILPHASMEGAIIRVDAAHSSSVTPQELPARETPTPEMTVLPVADEPAEPAVPSEPTQQWSWPPIVQRLLTCPAATELRDLAVQLRSLAADNDLRCIAFSGPGRKAGRTSLVLTLASVLIADKKTRVAIVDADFTHPDAASFISLDPAEGLEEVINNPGADQKAVTTLIEDRLAIVPLAGPVGLETIDNRCIGTLQVFLRSLRREYDLVLIDAGPWEADQMPPVLECRAVDAVVGINKANSARTGPADAADFLQPGVEWLGVIETFAPAEELMRQTA